MQGRRLPDIQDPADIVPSAFAPGDYALARQGARLYFTLPNGGFASITRQLWSIDEQPDGSITVSPSIYYNRGEPDEWHGYLERGVWRQV